MRTIIIAVGMLGSMLMASPAMAYTDSGLGYTNNQFIMAQNRSVPVSQPVNEPATVVTQSVPSVQPAQSVPVAQSAVPAQPAPTVPASPVAPVDTPTAWPTVPVYNATCNATLDNYPCDWSSQHFGITLTGPQDNQWVDFFLQLEAGLADGTIVLDPVTFEFKDQNGNVVW